jgi:antitoxin component YwqK of YwqJK toxin-antitoxin module
MNKPLTFLLSLTFLFLFSGSVYGDETIKTHWNNDKREGLDKVWYKNGRKKHIKHYKNDVLDRMVTEWYSSGKKKSTSHFKEGIENGFRKEWDENGKPTFQRNFVAGVAEIK